VLGVIQLKDIVKQSMAERFDELGRMGIRTVMITVVELNRALDAKYPYRK
jgi:high-affinity K+ transport system ATPase subunit B